MAKLPRETRPTPPTIRSRIVLEIASELVAMKDQPNDQAKILLRPQGASEWQLSLFGSSTVEGLHEVVARTSDLAIVNPASLVALAISGNGSYFRTPQPVRPIAVFPSRDSCMFAVRADLGLTRIEEIARNRVPLRLAVRGQRDHWLHHMLDDIVRAAGFTLDELRAWGGEVRIEGHIPRLGGPKFEAMARGEIDAIFDESVTTWANDATPAGMTVLQMSEATVARLEVLGYCRDVLPRAQFPTLPEDVLTIDFSGWPIIVREDASDDFVTRICTGMEARKHLIPWQEEGPLPIERMCRNCPDTRLTVPLHPAAERFWRQCGYV
jgi:hypothetical protein